MPTQIDCFDDKELSVYTVSKTFIMQEVNSSNMSTCDGVTAIEISEVIFLVFFLCHSFSVAFLLLLRVLVHGNVSF